MPARKSPVWRPACKALATKPDLQRFALSVGARPPRPSAAGRGPRRFARAALKKSPQPVWKNLPVRRRILGCRTTPKRTCWPKRRKLPERIYFFAHRLGPGRANRPRADQAMRLWPAECPGAKNRPLALFAPKRRGPPAPLAQIHCEASPPVR